MLPPLHGGRRRGRARSIAFPSIATGAYGFPASLAAKTGVSTLRATTTRVSSVLLVDVHWKTLRQYEKELLERPTGRAG